MRTPRFVSFSFSLAALAACAPHDDELEPTDGLPLDEPAAADGVEPRTGTSPYVRPDFVFRFDPAIPEEAERAAEESTNYALTQELPVGLVTITGTVRYDSATKTATFVPDADLDSRYPYVGVTMGDITPWVEGQPEDTVQAPCVDTDATIDGVPVSDGIPSCREQPGTWYHTQPLAAWGASPSQVDIFIEVDYYDSGALNPGGTPQWGALDRVRQAFLAEGYHVHFDVGDLYSSTYLDLENFNLGGGDPVGTDQGLVPVHPNFVMFTANPENACPPGGLMDLAQDNFISRYRRQEFSASGRERSFYYLVFLPEGEAGATADKDRSVAQLEGTNVVVALGHENWTEKFDQVLEGTLITDHLPDDTRPLLNVDCTHAYCNQIINYQAGTIMHEFGHNLGLRHHGGPGVSEHTPNYWSVMSYHYQTFGLPPDPGTYDGDRFFFALATKCDGNVHPETKAGLERGPLSSWKLTDPEHFIIDYSHGDLPDLYESSVDESLGIDGDPDSPWIDWNCDGIENTAPADLNGIDGINAGGPGENPLVDNDDWASLVLYHGYWDDQVELGSDWPNDGLPYPCSFNGSAQP